MPRRLWLFYVALASKPTSRGPAAKCFSSTLESLEKLREARFSRDLAGLCLLGKGYKLTAYVTGDEVTFPKPPSRFGFSMTALKKTY